MSFEAGYVGCDWTRYRQVGTAVAESWYCAGVFNGGHPIDKTAAVAVGTLYAMSVPFARSSVIDGLGINVTTLAALGVAKIGVYEATNEGLAGNLYPATYLGASAELDTSSTGAKTSTGLSIRVKRDSLVWFVAWFGTAAPVVASPNLLDVYPIGGQGAGGGTSWQFGWNVAEAYDGTFPDPFTAGGVWSTTQAQCPAIYYRLSG